MKPIAHVHTLHLLKAGCSVNFFMSGDAASDEDCIREPDLLAQVTFPGGYGSALLEALCPATLWVSTRSPDWKRALTILQNLEIEHSVNEAVRRTCVTI